MFLSLLFQAFLILLIFVFGRIAYMEYTLGDYGRCKVAAICAAVCYVTFAIFRLIRKRRERKAQREAEAFATVAYMAEEEEEDASSSKAYSVERAFVSGGTRFCCCVCEKWKPRRNAEAVLYEGRKVSGIICDKCAASFTPKRHETVKAMPR